MKLRVMSDLHTEFSPCQVHKMDSDKESVLILAGDISKGKLMPSWMGIYDEQFKHVVHVPGNHEYYYDCLPKMDNQIREKMKEYDYNNCHFLNQDKLVVDDVTIIGATLWANFDNLDTMSMYFAELWMTDYKVIKFHDEKKNVYHKLRATNTAHIHHLHRQYIFKTIKEEKEKGQKVVVVTHHLPSFQSIDAKYKSGTRGDVNGAYATELFEDIADTKPDLWIHGHTHASKDYMLADTRIVCNPRGYVPDEPNVEFNPYLVLEI